MLLAENIFAFLEQFLKLFMLYISAAHRQSLFWLGSPSRLKNNKKGASHSQRLRSPAVK